MAGAFSRFFVVLTFSLLALSYGYTSPRNMMDTEGEDDHSRRMPDVRRWRGDVMDKTATAEQFTTELLYRLDWVPCNDAKPPPAG